MRCWLAVIGLVFVGGCNGNGHVEQKPFVVQASDDVVNCACNLTFDNENCTSGTCQEHFEIMLCLPPALQQTSGGTVSAAAVDQYCRTTITNTVYHLIAVFNGAWCQYKAPYAPQGGVGSSVECFAQPIAGHEPSATTTDDGTCRTPCPEVRCDYHENCGQGVQDEFGNPDLDKCQCSRIIDEGICPGDSPSDFPTPLFCRPPKGTT
jgi:hypothetical protein